MSTTLNTNPAAAPRESSLRESNMVRFGVIGYGYWSPNVVRNLDSLDGSEVVAVCDKSATSRKRVQKAYPRVRVAAECEELLNSNDIDAIARSESVV